MSSSRPRRQCVTIATQTDFEYFDDWDDENDEQINELFVGSSTSELDLTDLELDDEVYYDEDFDEFAVHVQNVRVLQSGSPSVTSHRKDSGYGQSDDSSCSFNDDQPSHDVITPDDISSFSPLSTSTCFSFPPPVDVRQAPPQRTGCDDVINRLSAAVPTSGCVMPARRPVPRMGTRLQSQQQQQQRVEKEQKEQKDWWKGRQEQMLETGAVDRVLELCGGAPRCRFYSDSSAYQTGQDSTSSGSVSSPSTPATDRTATATRKAVAATTQNSVHSAVLFADVTATGSDDVTRGNEVPPTATSPSDKLEWVVHIRADGSRHITRRPAHRHAHRRVPADHTRPPRQRHHSAAGTQRDVITLWRQNVLRTARGEVWDGFTTVDELLVLGDLEVTPGSARSTTLNTDNHRLPAVTNV